MIESLKNIDDDGSGSDDDTSSILDVKRYLHHYNHLLFIKDSCRLLNYYKLYISILNAKYLLLSIFELTKKERKCSNFKLFLCICLIIEIRVWNTKYL